MSPALRKTLLVGLGAAAVAAGLPLSQAAAATATTTFAVTAVVVTTCSITATPMTFGDYSGVQLDGTATLNTTCSTGTPYSIGLNAGTAPTATVTTRQMTPTAGTELLNYALSQDAGHTINWGNTPGTDTPAPVTGNGTPQAVTVFGRIPAGQFIQAGEYSDTITVTLTF
jgi:spore coat protein U-like protein